MNARFEWNGQQHTDKNDYELEDEYDFSRMKIVPKGRFAPERRKGSNVVLLEPDIAQAFPSDEAVNAALRLVIQMVEIPTKRIKKIRAREKSIQPDKVSLPKHKAIA